MTGAITMNRLNARQFGAAGEYAVLTKLMFAGTPAQPVTSMWPGYDLIADTSAGGARISVKTRDPSDHRMNVGYHRDDVFDWLAIVLIERSNPTNCRYWLIPRAVADAHFGAWGRAGHKGIKVSYIAKRFADFENNFTLSEDPTADEAPVALTVVA
jgi:hypothetical protein